MNIRGYFADTNKQLSNQYAYGVDKTIFAYIFGGCWFTGSHCKLSDGRIALEVVGILHWVFISVEIE